MYKKVVGGEINNTWTEHTLTRFKLFKFRLRSSTENGDKYRIHLSSQVEMFTALEVF